MALVNFSLPYQSVTMAPFLYTGSTGGYTTANSLRLNTVLPSESTIDYNERESFRNEPYHIPSIKYHQHARSQSAQHRNHEIYTEHTSFSSTQDTHYNVYNQDFRRTQPRQQQQRQMRPPLPPSTFQHQQSPELIKTRIEEQQNYSERPIGYTRINGESSTDPGTKTSVHAILDYDDDFDDYYDEDHDIPMNAHVTPIQGPIFLKNNSVPVVPLYSYPQLYNGTFVQIPILWTALSIALGAELRGNLVRGAPCIKRYHQLFCPTAGNTYPIERIERFIDENKALMKRMYGDFEMNPEYRSSEHRGHRTRTRRKNRETRRRDIPDGKPRDGDSHIDSGIGKEYFSKSRNARQSYGKNRNIESGRIDTCESKVEIVTPYWASNSAGKIRAIVNTQHFEQAIHQEVCSKTQTNRCNGDCGCEQKYKWHRLLAYDPDNDCKGIFMDWFLFPSCCVCRCDPVNSSKFSSSGDRN